MKSHKKIARTVGILFIIATLAGGVGAWALAPALTGTDYLTSIAANEGQLIIGVISTLIMALAVVAISISVYPILKKQSISLSIGYITARALEAMFYFVQATLFLLLLTLSREYVAAGTQDVSYLKTIGTMIRAASEWSGHVILDLAVFSVGALIFNSILFKTKLVPRLISGFGILGAIMYFCAALQILFGGKPLSTIQIVLSSPLALGEMVLAIWLIVKGFSKSAIDKLSNSNS